MEFLPEQEFKHSFKLLRKKGRLGGILTLVAFAIYSSPLTKGKA